MSGKNTSDRHQKISGLPESLEPEAIEKRLQKEESDDKQNPTVQVEDREKRRKVWYKSLPARAAAAAAVILLLAAVIESGGETGAKEIGTYFRTASYEEIEEMFREAGEKWEYDTGTGPVWNDTEESAEESAGSVESSAASDISADTASEAAVSAGAGGYSQTNTLVEGVGRRGCGEDRRHIHFRPEIRQKCGDLPYRPGRDHGSGEYPSGG